MSGGPIWWEGMSELGHCWALTVGEVLLLGKGTWGTPRSPSTTASLGKSFTHLGLVFPSWADANILCLSSLPRPT